jgi:hypothetical protein
LLGSFRFRFAGNDYLLRVRLAEKDKAAKQHAQKSPRHNRRDKQLHPVRKPPFTRRSGLNQFAALPGLQARENASATRPNAEADIIDWQSGRGNYAQHANECLHSVDLAAYVLAKNSALQVRKHNVGPHR